MFVGYYLQCYFYINVLFTNAFSDDGRQSICMKSQYWEKVLSQCHFVHPKSHSVFILRSRPVFRAEKSSTDRPTELCTTPCLLDCFDYTQETNSCVPAYSGNQLKERCSKVSSYRQCLLLAM
jgi:hypothetical protein